MRAEGSLIAAACEQRACNYWTSDLHNNCLKQEQIDKLHVCTTVLSQLDQKTAP